MYKRSLTRADPAHGWCASTACPCRFRQVEPPGTPMAKADRSDCFFGLLNVTNRQSIFERLSGRQKEQVALLRNKDCSQEINKGQKRGQVKPQKRISEIRLDRQPANALDHLRSSLLWYAIPVRLPSSCLSSSLRSSLSSYDKAPYAESPSNVTPFLQLNLTVWTTRFEPSQVGIAWIPPGLALYVQDADR